MESDDNVSTPEQPRLPSTRPIDRRWDRSRGLIFSNAKRTTPGNYTWSHSDGIVFAEVPASRRGYSPTRDTFRNLRNSGQTTPAAVRDSVSDPHLVSSADIGKGHGSLFQQVEQERTAHAKTKQKYAQEKEQLRQDIIKQKAKLQADHVAMLAEERCALSKEMQEFREQKAESEKLRLQAERQIQTKNADLSRREAKLDDTITIANREAKATAESNVQDLMVSAQKLEQSAKDREQTLQRLEKEAVEKAKMYDTHYRQTLQRLEKEAVEKAKMYDTHYRESLDLAKKESREELQQRKQTQDRVAAARFVATMNELQKGPIRRHDVERKDYDAYHAVWDQIGDEMRIYSEEVFELRRLLLKISGVWNSNVKAFDRWRNAPRMSDRWRNSQDTDYEPPNFDTSFSQAYPMLSKTIQEFLSMKAQRASQNVAVLKEFRDSAGSAQDELDRASHFSRALTRYHHFEIDSSKYSETFIVTAMLNEEPLRAHRATVDREIDSIKGQLEAANGALTESTLRQKLQLCNQKLNQLAKQMAYFARLRDVESLEALHSGAIHDKATWAVTQKARDLQDEAYRAWSVHVKRNPAISTSSEVSHEQQGRNREQFVELWRAARGERRDVTKFIRSRVLLEKHMGELEDETVYDASIEKELEQARIALDEAMQRLVEPSAGRSASGRLPSPSIIASPRVAPNNNPKNSDATLTEQEAEVTAVKSRLEKPEAYATAYEKQKDERRLLQLKVILLRSYLENTSWNKAYLAQKSPGNHAQALNLQKNIDRTKIGLANAERRLKLFDEGERSDVGSSAGDGNTANPAVSKPEKRTPGRTRRRVRMHSVLRASSSRAVESAGKQEPVDDSTPAAPVPSKDDTGQSGIRFMGFKPTTAKNAPKPYWSADITFSHSGRLKQGRTSSTSPSSSSLRGSNRPSDHSTRLSQAIRQMSLEPTRANVSQHVDVDINKPVGFFSPNSSRLNFQMKSDDPKKAPPTNFGFNIDSPSTRPVNTPSDLDSSSEQSSDAMQSEDLSQDPETSPEHASTMQSEDSTQDISESGLVDDREVEVELTYQIPPEDYRNALLASPRTNGAFWNAKLYKNPSGKTPLVLYCISYDIAEARAKEFLNEPVIGFDIEWEPYVTVSKATPKQNVSLIQIAAEDKIGLFHIALFNGDAPEKLMPPSLRAIFESSKITKAGVNISGDATRLRKCLDVNMRGLFELSHLYRVVELSQSAPEQVNKKLINLAQQVHTVLGLPLKKGDVRTSAWSKKLQLEQTEYAASDAYAGFQLYHALEGKRKKMDPMPPRPAFWEERRPLLLGDGRKMVPKSCVPKRKRETVDDIDGETKEDDDECEEFFDTVEQLDAEHAGSLQTQDSAQSNISSSDESYLSVAQSGYTPDADDSSQERLHYSQPDSEESTFQIDKPRTHLKATKQQAPASPPEVLRADLWVSTWRASLPAEYNLRASNPSLRAYHMWHEQGLNCYDIAALLPNRILPQTVASYVMEALNAESLPFHAERVKEPLHILPKIVHGKYRKVLSRMS